MYRDKGGQSSLFQAEQLSGYDGQDLLFLAKALQNGRLWRSVICYILAPGVMNSHIVLCTGSYRQLCNYLCIYHQELLSIFQGRNSNLVDVVAFCLVQVREGL